MKHKSYKINNFKKQQPWKSNFVYCYLISVVFYCCCFLELLFVYTWILIRSSTPSSFQSAATPPSFFGVIVYSSAKKVSDGPKLFIDADVYDQQHFMIVPKPHQVLVKKLFLVAIKQQTIIRKRSLASPVNKLFSIIVVVVAQWKIWPLFCFA